MSVKGELKKLASVYEITEPANTIPKILGQIAVALGGVGTGKTVAEQINNIAVAKGYTEPEDEEEEVVVKYTVSYDANGGTGTIASVEVTAGESITVSDGTGLTAPEGKAFAGWAKTSSAQSPTVTSSFTPDKDTTLYAVWSIVMSPAS